MNTSMSLISSKLQEYLLKVGSGTEFEIRLGKLVFNKKTEKLNFDSNVEIDYFYRLKNFLNKKITKKEEIFTKETNYTNNIGKGNIRRILTTDKHFSPSGQEEIILKNSYKQFDIFDYDIRFSLASEKHLNKNTVNGVNWDVPNLFRLKQRISYIINIGKIDLTIVYQGTTFESALNSLPKYEVEFEINKKEAYSQAMELLQIMLQLKQNNFKIITRTESKDVFNNYKTLTTVPYFIGAQPETLQKDQLTLLYKELYSVTDKADGDRYFMFINNDSQIYFIDNNISGMVKTDMVSTSFKNTLVDGELIRKVDNESGDLISIDFYAFDILFFNGFDIRDDSRYLFKQRLDKLREVVGTYTSESGKYNIFIKKFIYRNVFMGSEIIMKDVTNKPYHNDGLIFTPMNEPYPKNKKWSKLLKWKPADQNSIDFYAVKSVDPRTGENIWELYVQDTVGQEQDDIVKRQGTFNELTKVLFDVNKLCPDLPNQTDITFKTTFDDSIIDPTTQEPYKSNTVIEFAWDSEMKKFVPLRTRWDKTSNPKKHGNFSQVACNIWNNIHNPITSNVLYKMTNTTTPYVDEKKDFFFERMNHFHSKIKKYLCNKYTNDKYINGNGPIYLLDICPGKNDLSYHLDFKGTLHSFEWECSDSKNSIRECCKNVKSLTGIDSYDFMEIPFDKWENKNNIVYNTIFSDNVRSGSGIYKFFESKNNLNGLIKFLNAKLAADGTFVLSFIDKEKYNNLLGNDNNAIFTVNNEIMYYMNKGKLYVNSITSENDNELHLIDSITLVEFMKSNGYNCIETEYYEKLLNPSVFRLNEYETNISNLMVYYVFTKSQNSDILPSIYNKTELIKQAIENPTQNHIDNNYIPINVSDKLIEKSDYVSLKKHKDVYLHKVESFLDIFNILNCIEFKLYKLNNKLEFNDKNIKEYFNNLNINIHFLNEQSTINDSMKTLVFFKYKFLLEEKDENGELINVEHQNYYVVLYKNKIFYNTSTFNDDVVRRQGTSTISDVNRQGTSTISDVNRQGTFNDDVVTKKQVGTIVEKKMGSVMALDKNDLPLTKATLGGKVEVDDKTRIKKELKVNNKITIATLKDYLKELKLKTTGNKQELLERLTQALK